jgi:release factor glutamine methyltransferase|tara:strand:+ start:980 stop:1840 length:861 start_codon:yes stop_codon:yes gene_type:complete
MIEVLLKDAQTLINSGAKKLSSVSNVPRLEAEVLLSNLLEINPIKFHTNEITVSQRLVNKFEAMIESRYKGIPIAYLVGKKEFWSMEFDINQSVLVPRPETELLIEQAVEVFGNHESPKILELGTGSGIISIVLSKELREPIITATDISHEALITAKNNADKHNINDINFVESNWFDSIKNEKFDLIISNPPYVDKSKLSNKELFGIDMEPDIALYSKNNGTSDLEIIIKNSPTYILDSGWLFLEHGYDQAEYCMTEMQKVGFKEVSNCKDIQNISRMTFGMHTNE